MSEVQNPAKGMSVAGMVLGLVALICSLVPCFWIPTLVWVPLLLGIVGLVLSVISKKKAKAAGAKTGLSTSGIVMSILGLIIVPIIYVLIISAVSSAVDSLESGQFNEQLQQMGDKLNEEIEKANQGQ